MKTVLLIPARYGSTRFEGKPLVRIQEKTMIECVYRQAEKARGVDEIYIATDDERIACVVRDFGGKVVMTTAPAISGTDRINDAAEQLGLAPDDVIINVQGDQPIVHPRSIEQLVELFQDSNKVFDMASIAYRITDEAQCDDPKNVKVVFDTQQRALYFSRSRIPFGRDVKKYPIYKHLGLYAYTRQFVQTFANLPQGQLEDLEKLEQLRALENGYTIQMVETMHDSPSIDTPEDIEACERVLLAEAAL